MRVVVTGASGQLGAAVVEDFRTAHDTVPLTRRDADLTDDAAVAAAVDRVGPHAIHRRPHGGIVGDVERIARERRHVVTRRAFVRHRGGELPARAHHRNSHVRPLSRR